MSIGAAIAVGTADNDRRLRATVDDRCNPDGERESDRGEDDADDRDPVGGSTAIGVTDGGVAKVDTAGMMAPSGRGRGEAETDRPEAGGRTEIGFVRGGEAESGSLATVGDAGVGVGVGAEVAAGGITVIVAGRDRPGEGGGSSA
jgi:hypothetical protein